MRKLPPSTVELAPPGAEHEEQQPDAVEVGQWYWVKGGKKPWLGCAVRIGTNYVELESPRRGTTRVHFEEFWDTCKFEPQPDRVIKGEIARYQQKVGQLLNQVKELTARLAIGQNPLLPGTNETQALSVRGSNNPDMKEYSSALVKAKEETLPALFEEIRRAHEEMAVWMVAEVVPLKAQAAGLKTVIGRIDDRIFSVELYAGLVEKVERVKEGKSAPLTTKIHLLQRRCYMDEECLARYKTGGMEFEDLHDFDAWLASPENFERLLPFPRCVVAFQVRRNNKLRELVNLVDLQGIIAAERADRLTFLYIRNGEQLFRLSTEVEFDAKLFPDMDRGQLQGKLWAKMYCDDVQEILTDNEHTAIFEEQRQARKDWEVRHRAYDEALKSPEAKAKAKAKGLKCPDASCTDVPWVSYNYYDAKNPKDYQPYDKTSVYYDDISKHIDGEIQKHNRIALILQGLLDRSPVLHPHPPWQLWSEDGFQTALELVYDTSRALVAGDKPDFEAYRDRCNASLKVGSVTVGQEEAWLLHEGAKESDRLDRDYRSRSDYRPTRFKPHGNPGPGTLARVTDLSKGKCAYAWNRKRQTPPFDAPTRTAFTCDSKLLLNVDAYKPGDFHIFFDDPRTRADYLEWAMLLLEAEEYHAGNRKIEEPPKPAPKKPSSWEAQRQYERSKKRKATIGQAVRLNIDLETKGGTKYKKGSLWRAHGGERGTFDIYRIKEDGTLVPDGGWVRCVQSYDFEIDPSIPKEPEEDS